MMICHFYPYKNSGGSLCYHGSFTDERSGDQDHTAKNSTGRIRSLIHLNPEPLMDLENRGNGNFVREVIWGLRHRPQGTVSGVESSGDFPGSPVVRTSHFHCRGPGFDPWSGN